MWAQKCGGGTLWPTWQKNGEPLYGAMLNMLKPSRCVIVRCDLPAQLSVSCNHSSITAAQGVSCFITFLCVFFNVFLRAGRLLELEDRIQ
jgi:hypothetical protein